MTALDRLNAMPAEDAERELLACCASRAWARAMADARPFRDAARLMERADAVWRSLGEADWHEAFRGHPRIGESPAAAPTARERAWSAGEQAGMSAAGVDTARAMAEANRAYEARFGHIYLVCATGMTAEQLLARLRERLANPPETEIRVAAEEQRRITRIRLGKLLDGTA